MTKKILAMFLAVLMVVSVLPTSVFATEDCKHTDSTVLSVVPATCKEGGYTLYQCNDCEKVYAGNITAKTTDHDYEPIGDKAPSCHYVGYKNAVKCSVCGDETGEEIIPALDAELSYDLTCVYEWDVTDFDCSESFSATRTCIYCGNAQTVEFDFEEKYEDTPYPGHDWTAWEISEDNKSIVVRECKYVYSVEVVVGKDAAGNEHEETVEIPCTCTEEKVAVAVHNHFDGGKPIAGLLKFVAEKAPECEEAGMKAHYICRECDAYVTTDGEVTSEEKLVIKSLHDELREDLDCAKTTVKCEVADGGCGKYVTVGSDAHDFSDWALAEWENACVSSGLAKRECSVCHAVETKIVAPLDHLYVTINVDATCIAYGYSYTICVRPGCPENTEAIEIPEGHEEAEYATKMPAPTAATIAKETGFYLYMNQTDLFVQKGLYFAGTLNGNALATTTDFQAAVKVFAEEVKKADAVVGYNLFFMNGETKTYIVVEAAKEGRNVVGVVKFADKAPKTYFVLDGGLKTTVKLQDVEHTFFLGTNKQGETIGAVATASYKANLFTMGFSATSVMEYTINDKAGLNEDNHDLENVAYTAPTCEAEGMRLQRCKKCNTLMDTETLEMLDHEYDEKITTKPQCGVKGEKTLTCKNGCGDVKIEEIPALEHTIKYETDDDGEFVLDEDDNKIPVEVEYAGDHINPAAWKMYVCAHCGKEFGKHAQTYWEFLGKPFDKRGDAMTAHGGTLIRYEAADVIGSCTKKGYEAYKCACTCTSEDECTHKTCGEIVLVWDGVICAHYEVPADKIVVGDCTTDGGYYNYKCEECGEYVVEGKDGKWFVVTTPAPGHDYEENEDFIPSTCEAPILDEDNYTHKCSECGHKLYAFELIEDGNKDNDKPLCRDYRYFEFKCAEHGSHIYDVVGNYGCVAGEAETIKKATCADEGKYVKKCIYCGEIVEEGDIAKLSHKDKNGNEFGEFHLTKNTKCEECKVTFTKNQHDYKLETIPATCESYGYTFRICSGCFDVQDAAEITKDTDGNAIELGHRPVEAEEFHYGFAYETVTYNKYEYANGKADLVKTVTYIGEYIEYKEATETEAGVAKFICADCGETIEITTKPQGKIFFYAEIVEGDYTFGSLVEVIVSIDGVNQAIDGFEFEVVADGMVFVGYEAVSVENGTVVADRNAKGNVQVYGWFKDNVEINAESQLVKLMFRVTENSNTEDALSVRIAGGSVEYTNEEGEPMPVTFGVTDPSFADVRMLLDVNGDNAVTFRDLAMLAAMIENGEYDVVCDINYNGVIDLQDMVEARKLYVDTTTVEDLAAKYLPAAHIEAMGIEICEVCGIANCTETHS